MESDLLSLVHLFIYSFSRFLGLLVSQTHVLCLLGDQWLYHHSGNVVGVKIYLILGQEEGIQINFSHMNKGPRWRDLLKVTDLFSTEPELMLPRLGKKQQLHISIDPWASNKPPCRHRHGLMLRHWQFPSPDVKEKKLNHLLSIYYIQPVYRHYLQSSQKFWK